MESPEDRDITILYEFIRARDDVMLNKHQKDGKDIEPEALMTYKNGLMFSKPLSNINWTSKHP